jgi:peptidoglycan hydrolase-like protein with peptidoglycan-binding domain
MRLTMRGAVCLAGSVVIAASLWAAPARALASGRLIQYVQNAPGASDAPVEPAPANSREQIRKAQTELKRLDCLKGRIDGNLGPRTRKAVNDYWAMAKQPAAVEVNITDALIAELAARGDNYCRPARPFFSFGGRGGGGNFVPPFAPGARPGPLPGTVPRSPAEEGRH